MGPYTENPVTSENSSEDTNTSQGVQYYDACQSYEKEKKLSEYDCDPEEKSFGDEEIFKDLNDQTGISFTKTKKVTIQVRDLSIGSRITSSGKFSSKRLNPFKKGFHRKEPPADIESNADIKTILHPMSFDIPACSITCIIGGSGSGKTTLLNCLADRKFNRSSLFETGKIQYNNDEDLTRIRNAYVIQQDILIPTLTCRETLMYAAEFKLPKLTSKKERCALVHELILELGLKECADTIVGDNHRKGLSGGEKRRLSVALQLVSNPAVLFLDEPTTGLDSYNAYLLCITLKRVAKKFNKTIVMSIHQPRADIFKLFDRIFILSKGNLCYADSYEHIFEYFSRIGYPIPEHNVNPADFLIDLITIDTRTYAHEQESSKRMAQVSRLWKEKMDALPEIEEVSEEETMGEGGPGSDGEIFESLGRAPFMRELGIHIRRNLKLQYRDPLGTASVILEALLLGIITGWIFYKPGTDTKGIRSLESSLYMSSTLMCYLYLLVECYRLCQLDLKVFDRERLEGCISVPGFLIGRRISKLITEDIFIPIAYAVPTYFMIGLRTDSAKYFWKYFAGIFIFNLNTMAVGMLAAAFSRDVSIATLICNLNFTFQTMTNGMFINAKQLPVYVRWCKYVAYQWYSFGFLISNQFTNFNGDCYRENAGNPNVNDLCYTSSGSYIIGQMGFWENWNALPICVVLAFFLGTYILAGIVLHFKPVDISMGKEAKTRYTINNKIKRDIFTDDSKEISKNDQGVSVKIRGINLTVRSKMGKVEKQILRNVEADFQACKLNIIMGPSGSGKTSLLNLISGRLSSSLASSYISEGKIYFNQYEVEDFSIVRPLCSYVTQEDDYLLSSLTVKETISYAAELRLSRAKLSKAERKNIVEKVILDMGLRDCANTLVGNDLIKGISGGEKRRLSIAIQLLSSPKILFLDEPTSGLDAFTASSIVECLQKLARSGTTIIMTIHQPRTLDQFGTILLLAKGGMVAFDGSQDQLIQHFTQIGYPVPKFTNLGDFVIDLISYNTVNEDVELRTRARVDNILDRWNEQNGLIITNPIDTVVMESQDQLRAEFKSFVKEPADFLTGFHVLLRRQWVGLIRDTNIIIARAAQVLGMGIILTFFFARLKHDVLSVQNRFGVIQQMVSLYFSGMLNNMTGYPKERDYFYNEYSDDVVSISSFFFSYLIIELPFEIFPCLIFAVLMVFAIGFQYNTALFFGIFYTTTIVVNAGESLGISFNTALSHPGFSLTVISVFCSIAVCMSGLMSMTLNSFLKAMNYLSPPHYCVLIITNLVFTKSLKIDCLPDQKSADGSCQFSNGLDVLSQYGLKVNMTLYWIMISVMAVLHRGGSFLFLKMKLTKLALKRKSSQ